MRRGTASSHASWKPAPFRYLRRREAPDAAFAAAVAAAKEPVYVFFRHGDEPTAPQYAAELAEMLAAA